MPNANHVSTQAAKLEVRKMLTLSTAHFTLGDRAIFELVTGKEKVLLSVLKYRHGYVIRRIGNEQVTEMKELGFSIALLNVVKFARDNGFDVIEFDCDADVIDGLQVFDW